MQEDSTLLEEEEGSDGVGSHSPFQRNFVDTSLLHKCSVVQYDGDIYMRCLYMVVLW